MRSSLSVILLLIVAACAAPGVGTVPRGLSYADARRIVPDKRGSVKFFPDTYGDPTPDGITAGPDGALWFTDPGMDVIGRITAGGTYTLEAPAGTEVSTGITVGPDKNLWFTTFDGVGRITTAGTVTLFTDPSGSFPQGITTGPDGALWFAESNGTVGRITTSGTVTHVTVAAANAGLFGIVTGSDGNLWVTQNITGGSHFANKLFRLTPKGKIKTFTVGSGPAWICVGPDKALWFTEEDANAIGRLTTAGKYTEFPTTMKYGEPSGIAKGPDGALWFTDFTGDFGIGRITTAGRLHFYRVPSGAAGLQIASGPRRAMWFTSSEVTSGIGRIATR